MQCLCPFQNLNQETSSHKPDMTVQLLETTHSTFEFTTISINTMVCTRTGDVGVTLMPHNI